MGWPGKASLGREPVSRHKGGEEVSHVDIWGVRAADSGDRVSRGSEARAKSMFPSRYRKASVARVKYKQG